MLKWLSNKYLDGQIKQNIHEDALKQVNISWSVREKWERQTLLGLQIGLYSITGLFIFVVAEKISQKGLAFFGWPNGDFYTIIFIYFLSLSFSIFPLALFSPSRKTIASEYESAFNQMQQSHATNKQRAMQKQEEERRMALAERNRIAEEERRAELARKKWLQDIEDEEAAKARGKAKGLAELYKTQIDLMIKYKREGINIENDIYEMRKRLLSLEKQENKEMVEELLQTLDKI